MCVWPRGQVRQDTVGLFILAKLQSATANEGICHLKVHPAEK